MHLNRRTLIAGTAAALALPFCRPSAAISSDHSVASPIRWISAMLAYQRKEYSFGGSSMNIEWLNEASAVVSTGSTRKAMASQATTAASEVTISANRRHSIRLTSVLRDSMNRGNRRATRFGIPCPHNCHADKELASIVREPRRPLTVRSRDAMYRNRTLGGR